MGRWLLAIESDCSDPAREKEFNDWYDNIHLPNVLESPSVLRASRYETDSPADGRGKFLALYDIESDNIEQTMAAFWDHVSEKWTQGRMSALMAPASAIVYRQITPTVEMK